ncbi:MAG TPA: carboxylating nicotinate-nucleotide diphosphorylase [Acidiferrobacter sp.]|nr:carboxylating nicotinate-nucleotide diphosphorylase [Acidiferrobacter sp.]
MISPAIKNSVRAALEEDVGSGDLTALLVPEGRASAVLITREDGVLCGQAWFDETFHQLGKHVDIQWQVADAERVHAGDTLCTLTGPARVLLTGERTAINFLQTLSGTATVARQYADSVAHTKAQVLDTRKTLPGLRAAQKYAVRCGGCGNHRLGLYDGVLIKENHIVAAGSVTAALRHAHIIAAGKMIEIEVETLAQLKEAIVAKAPRVLLDNFSLAELREAVQYADGRVLLEASGGITLDNIAAQAETGVDFLSVGDLTKSIRALDMSMRLGPVSEHQAHT